MSPVATRERLLTHQSGSGLRSDEHLRRFLNEPTGDEAYLTQSREISAQQPSSRVETAANRGYRMVDAQIARSQSSSRSSSHGRLNSPPEQPEVALNQEWTWRRAVPSAPTDRFNVVAAPSESSSTESARQREIEVAAPLDFSRRSYHGVPMASSETSSVASPHVQSNKKSASISSQFEALSPQAAAIPLTFTVNGEDRYRGARYARSLSNSVASSGSSQRDLPSSEGGNRLRNLPERFSGVEAAASDSESLASHLSRASPVKQPSPIVQQDRFVGANIASSETGSIVSPNGNSERSKADSQEDFAPEITHLAGTPKFGTRFHGGSVAASDSASMASSFGEPTHAAVPLQTENRYGSFAQRLQSAILWATGSKSEQSTASVGTESGMRC
jgi:hypothetical protein